MIVGPTLRPSCETRRCYRIFLSPSVLHQDSDFQLIQFLLTSSHKLVLVDRVKTLGWSSTGIGRIG